MDFSVISLIVLVVVVAIGFIKKVNLGFLSLGVAFILGTCGGMSAKEIANGFSASMFVTLVGVTFLFGMASNTVVALVGKNTVLIPVLMFFLSAFISAIGPGHIAAGILMTTFAMYLAFEMDINPIATALFAKLGANAGCASPLSLTGVLAKSLGEPLGYTGFGLHLFLTTLISGFIFTLILYVGFKSYKVKADNPLKLSEIPKFNKEQLCTIAAIIVMVICCIGFQLDTGLFAFVAASVLILLGCADEKKAIKSIPWGTLVFICGVGALINVIKKLSGIDLISNFLTGLMTEGTATPILAATSGILSWVSSTTGVVMPALFPIAADVATKFSGSVNFVELISAIVATSFAAAISPLSTGGAIIMSSYSAARETSNEEMNRMFKQLFLLSVANVAVNVLLSALGVFNLFGLFY